MNSERKYRSGVQSLVAIQKINSASFFPLHLIHDSLSTRGLTRVEITEKTSNSVLSIMWVHLLKRHSRCHMHSIFPTLGQGEYPLATRGMRQEERWNYFNHLSVCLSSLPTSPAWVSYRGPLTKAENHSYKTEDSWIDAKQSQRKSRISNRLDERIAGSKLQGDPLNLKNCLKKSRLKCYSQVPSRLKAKQKQLGFPGALNHPFKPKETDQPTTHRNSNPGYAWNVKLRAEWTERHFPSLITEKCSNAMHYL